MSMSQREAARIWGVSRASIQRAISSGKLSRTTDKLIDPAEMLRVFGPASSRSNEPVEPPNEPPAQDVAQLAALRAENAALRELVKRADAERDRALETVQRLLTHDRPGRSRWWPFGRKDL
jgi:hypothetical protein